MSSENLPIIIHTHDDRNQEIHRRPGTDVPHRVCVAMAFVEHVTAKTAYKALPVKKGYDSSTDYEPLPLIELNVNEKDAYNAALELLGDYFSGEMKEASMERLERDREDEREKHARLSGGPITVIDCPQCGGGSNQYRCLLCRTKGKVTIGMVP